MVISAWPLAHRSKPQPSQGQASLGVIFRPARPFRDGAGQTRPAGSVPPTRAALCLHNYLTTPDAGRPNGASSCRLPHDHLLPRTGDGPTSPTWPQTLLAHVDPPYFELWWRACRALRPLYIDPDVASPLRPQTRPASIVSPPLPEATEPDPTSYNPRQRGA